MKPEDGKGTVKGHEVQSAAVEPASACLALAWLLGSQALAAGGFSGQHLAALLGEAEGRLLRVGEVEGRGRRQARGPCYSPLHLNQPGSRPCIFVLSPWEPRAYLLCIMEAGPKVVALVPHW